MNNEKINIYVISDSLGETGFSLLTAGTVQFPKSQFNISRFPLVKTKSLLTGILNKAKKDNAIVLHTLVNPELSGLVNNFCQENNLQVFDALTDLVNILQNRTKETPLYASGLNHNMNTDYFKRIEALEFAVTYDDGKDPAGFLKADIVLLGVSRTSKTPLSLYLANQGYKVANLPLVPKAQIPDEIFKVDKNKIFGLTNDPEVLNNIRRQRMIAYGLNPDTTYSNVDNINEELEFAKDLYKKLGCLQINVAKKSIEETATIIIESLGLNS